MNDTNDKETVALLCSGGIDSTALIGYILNKGDVPFLINMEYGAANNFAERAAINEIMDYYSLPIRYEFLEIENRVMFAEQVSMNIAEQSFEEMGVDNSAIFPGRNALLISMAAATALARNITTLYLGIAQHDTEANFPDCSHPFLHSMQRAMLHGYDLKLDAPYYYRDRSAVIKEAYERKVPLHLSYSCYRGGTLHCGKCATCYSRQQSFEDAGFVDPTEYLAGMPDVHTTGLEEWNVQDW